MSQAAEQSVYPDEGIFKFDKEFADQAIYTQEKDIREHISDVVLKQDIIDKIGFGNYLTKDVKYMFNTVLCTMLRYKRLNDLIAQAANINEITRNNAKWRGNWLDKLAFFEDKKENSTQWYVKLKEKGVLSGAQMKTLIKYSLDTPAMLYIILRENGFFYNWSDDKDYKDATDFRPQRDGDKGYKLLIGTSLKSGYLYGRRPKNDLVYLDVNGNFVTQRGNACTLLGLGAEAIFDNKGNILPTAIGDIKKQEGVSLTKESLVNTSGIGVNAAAVVGSFFFGVIPLALTVAKTVADIAIPNISNIYTSEKSKALPIWTIDAFGASFSDKMKMFDTLKIYFNEKNVIQNTSAYLQKKTDLGVVTKIKSFYKDNKPVSFIKLDAVKKIGGTRKPRRNMNRRTQRK